MGSTGATAADTLGSQRERDLSAGASGRSSGLAATSSDPYDAGSAGNATTTGQTKDRSGSDLSGRPPEGVGSTTGSATGGYGAAGAISEDYSVPGSTTDYGTESSRGTTTGAGAASSGVGGTASTVAGSTTGLTGATSAAGVGGSATTGVSGTSVPGISGSTVGSGSAGGTATGKRPSVGTRPVSDQDVDEEDVGEVSDADDSDL